MPAETKKYLPSAAFLAIANRAVHDSLHAMDGARDGLPDDIGALKAALIIERAKALEVAAELAVARAKASQDMALIAHQKLRIARLERQLYGQRSERSARLIDQLALAFEELRAGATEDELAAEAAIARTTTVTGFTRHRPERNTFPEHLPRERVVIDPPTTCDCCGGNRLRKLGEDVTRTLESQPRLWKVIETVREKFTCRDCEKITQAPAPFHVVPRGWAGPSLLAMIMFEKFGQHQPLNRQAERYALEGVPIALSTMADAVGSVCPVLDPLWRLIEAHVMAAERLHADDTTVPVLAEGKTDIARCWIYLRDDKPFGGTGPPAAIFHYSRDRKGEHPQAHLAGYTGILQADAYDGYGKLYLARANAWAHHGGGVLGACPAPVLRHGRYRGERPAQGGGQEGDPAVTDRDRDRAPYRRAVRDRAIHQWEKRRGASGGSPRQSRPLVEELEVYMRAQLDRLSRGHDLAKAINYILKRRAAFSLFLEDGRVCLSNNAAERGLRGIALGRKSWLFCGSDRGGQRAAMMYSLIVTAKMNDVDPQAWLADVLSRIAAHPAHRLDELLPWNWRSRSSLNPAQAA